jgi:hypothetical protein
MSCPSERSSRICFPEIDARAQPIVVIFTEAECLIVEEALGNGTITTVISENKGGG